MVHGTYKWLWVQDNQMIRKNQSQQIQAGGSADWEQMESTFLKCLHEIERSYVHLPKMSRIRVEKWIEKLVATGNNTVWRKHRNAYARLLLNMVITRNLSEPFNLLPPDGPLPSFPFHMKPTKDLLGPHETSFWRTTYERLQENPKENVKNGLSLADVTANHGFDPHGGGNYGFGLNREINNLNLLIREQNERIQLLEQQLHEERVKHELQIQRLHYTHRTEINQLLESSNITNGNNSIASTVRWSKDVHLSNNQKNPAMDDGAHASFDHQRRSALSPNRYRPHNAFTPQRSHSPSSILNSRANRYGQSNEDIQRYSREFGDGLISHSSNTESMPREGHMNCDALACGSRKGALQNEFSMYHANDRLASFSSEHGVTDLPPTVSEFLQPVKSDLQQKSYGQVVNDVGLQPAASTTIDIVPFPKHSPNMINIDASTIDHAIDGSSMYHKLISEEKPNLPTTFDSNAFGINSLAAVDPPNAGMQTRGENQDDDFLSYLDQFQTELRKVQSSVNLNEDVAHLSEDSLHT